MLSEDIVSALKLLHDKGYLDVEDWGLFDEAPDESVPGYRQNFITCWLNQDAVLEAIYTYYCKHLAPPPPHIEGFDVRRERRVVTHHVHRAPGGAGGNADVRGVGRDIDPLFPELRLLPGRSLYCA